MRTHALIWLALVAAAVGFLFYTSHQAQELRAELEAGNRAVIAEQESIRVLHAEWAYLNEPGRLRELARRHTPLGPAMPSQIVTALDDVPARLPGVGALPRLPVPPRKPRPGAVATVVSSGPLQPDAAEIADTMDADHTVDIAPEREPPAATAVPPRPAPPSVDTMQTLMAEFRALQAAAQAGGGQ